MRLALASGVLMQAFKVVPLYASSVAEGAWNAVLLQTHILVAGAAAGGCAQLQHLHVEV